MLVVRLVTVKWRGMIRWGGGGKISKLKES